MGFWPVVKRVVKDSDILIMVLDVRMPELSRNKILDRMIELHGKKSVRVFTKVDLVSEKYLRKIMAENIDALFVSGVKNIGVSELRRRLLIMAKKMKLENPRIGVVGYPNIGKSALINALARRAKTVVSKKAGATRGIQWVKAGQLFILDSPGVVPFDDKEVQLGVLGSKNPDKLRNVERVALAIIKLFLNYEPKILEVVYGFKIESEDEVLEDIAKRKGFLLSGARADVNRAALLIMRDWQMGKLRL